MKKTRVYKCCRFCGTVFPTEYGYYKMMPVVLLGSHFSGKTSYLLSLLYTVTTRAPFIQDGTDSGLNVMTLDNDTNLIAFNKNIDNYRKGLPPIKTDFENVPVLNLRVNDVIYTFIDWPGEKFIDETMENDAEFVFEHKIVIKKARHFICFFDPSQIDLGIDQVEENVKFNTIDLNTRFDWHMKFPNSKKVRTISYVVNKIDKLKDRPNADTLIAIKEGKTETNVYDMGKWQQKEFDQINDATKRYFQVQNPILFSGLDRILNSVKTISKVYLPVAPYGKDAEEKNINEYHYSSLVGVPFLNILKTDGVIR